MAQTFSITPKSGTVTVAAGQTTTVAFTLTNSKPEAIDVQVSLDTGTPEPTSWLTLEGAGLRSVAPGGAPTQIEVTVAPPTEHPDDVVTLKVVVASTTHPEEDWATSPGVSVRVGKGDGPAWKKWLPLVAGLVLILGAGIGLAVWLSGRSGPKEPKVGQACTAEAPCPDGLVCASQPGGKSTCLFPDGGACVSNAACKSGFCDGEVAVCARPPVHTPCEGASQCFPGQACVDLGGSKLCVWQTGEACGTDLECQDGFCKEAVCVAYDGTCANAAACRDSEKCIGGTCLLKDGEQCADNIACASGDCEGGVCKASGQPTTNVCANGCPAGLVCFPRRGCMPPRGNLGAHFSAKDLERLKRAAAQSAARVNSSAAMNAKRAAAKVRPQ
ncbi:MAG: hypothetical protein KC933_30585 [Myxococcales bacterium]|nr:hypothetical protein [Myxococcales bacterium]